MNCLLICNFWVHSNACKYVSLHMMMQYYTVQWYEGSICGNCGLHGILTKSQLTRKMWFALYAQIQSTRQDAPLDFIFMGKQCPCWQTTVLSVCCIISLWKYFHKLWKCFLGGEKSTNVISLPVYTSDTRVIVGYSSVNVAYSLNHLLYVQTVLRVLQVQYRYAVPSNRFAHFPCHDSFQCWLDVLLTRHFTGNVKLQKFPAAKMETWACLVGIPPYLTELIPYIVLTGYWVVLC